MGKYTWVIVRDKVLGSSSDAVGMVGPGGEGDRARADQVIREGTPFRMRTLSGEVRFYGYILGEYEGPEPLQDFGLAHDCTAIEYRRNGTWIELF